MVLLENIFLCNLLWDWKSKSDSCLKFLNKVRIFKSSLLALQHCFWEVIPAAPETGTQCRAQLCWGLCLAWNSEELPVWCKRGELRESADEESHWFASTWASLMLILTYFLVFPCFRVPYSLIIIFSYVWLLNSKGLSEHIWKGSGPDTLFCEIKGGKRSRVNWGIGFELWKLFTSGIDFFPLW